jgi:hypothetical protein
MTSRTRKKDSLVTNQRAGTNFNDKLVKDFALERRSHRGRAGRACDGGRSSVTITRLAAVITRPGSFVSGPCPQECYGLSQRTLRSQLGRATSLYSRVARTWESWNGSRDFLSSLINYRLFIVPCSLFLVPCSLSRTTSFLEQILLVVSLTRYLVHATLTTLWSIVLRLHHARRTEDRCGEDRCASGNAFLQTVHPACITDAAACYCQGKQTCLLSTICICCLVPGRDQWVCWQGQQFLPVHDRLTPAPCCETVRTIHGTTRHKKVSTSEAM